MDRDDFDARMAAFEVPAKRFGSVKLNLTARPLKCGLVALERYEYLRAAEPDLVVVGARPGNGKTSFLVQTMLHVARHEGPTMMFSLEMATSQLLKRAVAAESGVPIRHLRNAGAKADAAQAAIDKAPFFVDDTKGLDINTLRARVLDMHKRTPLAAVGVDYLQIVRTSGGRSKREEVAEAAEGLKKLAEDIQAPVVALAQMSRDIEKRQQLSKTARPTMSDLQECALIENWADMILFLDGAGKRDPSRAGQVDVYGAKHRHGEAADFVLFFQGETTRFSDFNEEQGL